MAVFWFNGGGFILYENISFNILRSSGQVDKTYENMALVQLSLRIPSLNHTNNRKLNM